MITCKFEGINHEVTWHLSAMYAECDRVKGRNSGGNQQRSEANLKVHGWLCGDSNISRYQEDRTNGQRISGTMSDFSDWINDMELADYPLFLGSFTWRSDNDGSASRIDRFFCSSHWEEMHL